MRRVGPPERPLDRIPSLKLKLGAVIFAAVALTVIVFWAGVRLLDLWPSVSGMLAMVIALVMVRYLARGMTSPLREMARAADAMARGDYERRVTATSSDEVGQLARAFNAMAEELALTDTLRRDLVANVSHELRTPITVIRARLENIADGIEPADRGTIDELIGQVDRLERLVSQLLDLSKLESGSLALDRRPFEVEPMLAHAGGVGGGTQERDVEVRVGVDPRGLSMTGDPERLHQVIVNLVENAVRHSPRGGVVTVDAHVDGEAIVLSVADQGPGIPDADTNLVFERFYRADSARASRDGGAGLGLAIVRWIVDLHEGDISPLRVEPHGCRMQVTLPGAADVSSPAAV